MAPHPMHAVQGFFAVFGLIPVTGGTSKEKEDTQ